MTRFQDEHFRHPVVSFDIDVINTWETLMSHIPESNKDNHLFLACILSSRTNVWYKGEVKCGERNISQWMKIMARNAGIEGDITNKSGRVTSITRMLAARIPPEVIAQITGHRHLKTLSCYNKIAILKAKATQNLLRDAYDPVTNEMHDFDYHYNLVMQEYHRSQVGCT